MTQRHALITASARQHTTLNSLFSFLRRLRWLLYVCVVSNRTQVALAFITSLRLNPMTEELRLRYLAKAGLIPLGLPGRRAPEWSRRDLKNRLLATPAHLPSEAVEAVRILNDLPSTPNERLNHDEHRLASSVKKGVTFGDWVMEEIEKRSRWIEPEYDPISDAEAARLYQEHYVSMTLDPPLVTVVAPNFDRPDTSFLDTFGGSGDEPHLPTYPVLSRETRFDVRLLIMAGQLLLKQPRTSTPEPAPGRAGEGGDATPGTTRATGSGNHGGPVDTPAPRTRRRRPSNKAQPTTAPDGKQLPLGLAAEGFGERVRGAGSSTCNP